MCTEPHKNCRRDQALAHHHFSRHGVALAGTRHLRSQGLVPVHAHRTEGVTGSERQEGSNAVGRGIGVGGGNGDGNGVGGGDGDGAGMGTGRGVEANEGAQDGNRDGSGDGAGTGTGWRALDEHRMGTGTRVGTETRAMVEM